MKNVVRKYKTFFKYIISAGISFIIDIGLFALLSRLLFNYINNSAIIVATVIARVMSSLINYTLNKNRVFENKDGKAVDKNTFIKYYFLVIIQMGVSAFSVWVIHEFINTDATIIKILVDIVIFIINYLIQKKYIFKK